jgi:hypothetical protein
VAKKDQPVKWVVSHLIFRQNQKQIEQNEQNRMQELFFSSVMF